MWSIHLSQINHHKSYLRQLSNVQSLDGYILISFHANNNNAKANQTLKNNCSNTQKRTIIQNNDYSILFAWNDGLRLAITKTAQSLSSGLVTRDNYNETLLCVASGVVFLRLTCSGGAVFYFRNYVVCVVCVKVKIISRYYTKHSLYITDSKTTKRMVVCLLASVWS